MFPLALTLFRLLQDAPVPPVPDPQIIQWLTMILGTPALLAILMQGLKWVAGLAGKDLGGTVAAWVLVLFAAILAIIDVGPGELMGDPGAAFTTVISTSGLAALYYHMLVKALIPSPEPS